MDWEELLLEKEISSEIKFEKEMMTVYDLSYILIDFQAVVNNLTEIIVSDLEGKYQILEEKSVIRRVPESQITEGQENRNEIIEQQHPSWQKKIEDSIESMIFESPKVAADHPRAITSYKQTTSRNFNKKHRMNLELNGFSKGSLFLDLTNSLIVSLLTEFLKELVVKKTEKQNIININIYSNPYIIIDGSTMNAIPKDSCMGRAIHFTQGSNQSQLDVKKCIHNVVEASKPDQDIEASVRRFFQELEKNRIVSEQVIYDERGIKTAVRDIERFTGNFMDIRI